MASEYFQSANKQIDESKAGLLQAVATGGTAGKQAYEAAQAQAAQAQRDAVARAAERSALYGVGGNDQTFLGAYDARANQMGVNRSNFESGLAQTQASGESYLEKARASIPVLEAQNLGKVTDQETKIKNTIAAAQAKAQADFEKEQRAEQARLDREDRAEQRAIDRENRAAGRDAAKDAAKGPDISLDSLLGAASQHSKAPAQKLRLGGTTEERNQIATDEINRQLAGQGDAGKLTDLAASIGRLLGVPETKLWGLNSPSKQSTLSNNVAPTPDAAAKALATKYDTKGVNYDTAKSVLGNVDFKEAVNTFMSLDPATTTWEDQERWVRDNFITRDGRNWTAEYWVLMGEYVDKLFQKAA